MRQLIIRARGVAIRARVLDTPTADRIFGGLPVYGAAHVQDGDVVVGLPLDVPLERGARDLLRAGEIAFSPARSTVVIARGPPHQLVAGCNVWARLADDVRALDALDGLADGAHSALLHVDS